MSPWRRSIDKLSIEVEEKEPIIDGEGLSPNLLMHSRLGNYSTVGPLSQNSEQTFDFKEKTIEEIPVQDLKNLKDEDYLKNLSKLKDQLANTIGHEQKWVEKKTSNNNSRNSPKSSSLEPKS